MALFDFLKKVPRNPTAEWQRDDTRALEVDFMSGALAGVRCGDAIDRLAFLGPSSANYDFPQFGLKLDVIDGRLVGFSLVMSPDDCESLFPAYDGAVQPFTGTVQAAGADWGVRDLSHERRFVELLGPAYWRDTSDEEILLFFEFPPTEVQVECMQNGQPSVVVVTGEALLADPDQRVAYGVTVPWPPPAEGRD